MIEEQDTEQKETVPGRFELRPTPGKAWHAPDSFRLMDPPPPVRYRGIIITVIVLVVGLLLLSDDTPNVSVMTRKAQLDIQSQSQPLTEERLRAQLATPQNDFDQVAPVTPEPIQEGQSEEQPQTAQTQSFRPDSGIDNQWRPYRVEPGKTVTRLFRDRGLPAVGVYAVVQVEGAGKSLSSLQNGQMVKIRQNASSVVIGLTTDTGNNQQVLFTRQPDDSFIRMRQMKDQPKAS